MTNDNMESLLKYFRKFKLYNKHGGYLTENGFFFLSLRSSGLLSMNATSRVIIVFQSIIEFPSTAPEKITSAQTRVACSVAAERWNALFVVVTTNVCLGFFPLDSTTSTCTFQMSCEGKKTVNISREIHVTIGK